MMNALGWLFVALNLMVGILTMSPINLLIAAGLSVVMFATS
jgi:hypothetical protein